MLPLYSLDLFTFMMSPSELPNMVLQCISSDVIIFVYYMFLNNTNKCSVTTCMYIHVHPAFIYMYT